MTEVRVVKISEKPHTGNAGREPPDAKTEAWIEEALAKIRASVEGNVCCECGGTITKKVQVGRCVYAEPCNHRLYQGTIK